jgi:hypothetical protein
MSWVQYRHFNTARNEVMKGGDEGMHGKSHESTVEIFVTDELSPVEMKR